MPTETTQILTVRLIDYAGLFPPANLGLRQALAEFARRMRGDDAWMLGRLIVPVDQLETIKDSAQELVPRGRRQRPWALSVLVSDDFEKARDGIDTFNRYYSGRAAVETVELKPTDAEEIARAARAFEGLKIFFELSHQQDPGPLMAAVATLGGRAKIRTGGVAPESFPSAAEIVRFLSAARRTGVALKATAGLHHALPGEYRLTYEKDSATAPMHGFLNFALLSAWIHHEAIGEEDALELLAEHDPKAFTFTADDIAWRDYRLSREELTAVRRKFLISFGSCSFEEPVKELRSLKLL